MAEPEPTIWGIHGGRHGEADPLFIKGKCVAIGWREMGDLSKLKPEREAFKTKFAEVVPMINPGRFPLKLVRFSASSLK